MDAWWWRAIVSAESFPLAARCKRQSGTEQARGFVARQPTVAAFRLGRKGNLRNDARRVLRMVRVDGSTQILKPAPGGLIGNSALTWLNPGVPVVFIRRAGGPVHEVAAQLGLELAHRLVTEEAIKIEKPDEQQIVLRPGSPVVLVLGPFGYLVGCKDVGYGEDAGVSCADCGRVPSADIGFERFRSAINVVAAATCADLPSLSL